MEHFANQPSTSSQQIERVVEDGKPETMYEYVDENGQTVLIEGSSIFVDEDGNTIIYTDGQEVVQEEVVEIEEESPRKTNKNPIGYPKSTVLLTNKCLEAEKAALNVKSGSSKRKPVKETEANVITNQEISILNKNLPGMKNMFKVVSESAMNKVTLKKIGEVEKIPEKPVTVEEKMDETDNLDPPKTPPRLEKQSGPTIEPLEFYKQWPFYSRSVIDFKMACEILIGSTVVESARICKSIPLEYKGTGTFVIDSSAERGWQYNRNNTNFNDNNGRWSSAQGKIRYYKEDHLKKLVRADDGKGQLKDWAMDTYTYKVLLRKYDHEDTKRQNAPGQGMFQKKIYSASMGNGENTNRVIVTYSWIGGKAWNYLEKPKKDWKLEKGGLPQVVSAFFEGFTLFSHEVVDFNQIAAILLGGTVVDQNKICGSVPLGYRQTGTFVVDMKRLKLGHLELRKDDNGLWGKPSGQNRFYKFAENGDAVRVDKCGKLMAGIDYDVKLTCKRYEHTQVEKKFVRKIYVAKGKDESPTFDGSPDVGVIVYYWKGEPISFDPLYKQNEISEARKNIEEGEDDDEFVVTECVSDIIPPAKRARVEIKEAVVEVRNNVVEDNEYRNMKMELIRREIENQDCFSSILSRADSLLSRLEQRFLHEEHVIVEEAAIYHQEEQHIEQEVPQHYSDGFLEHSNSQ